MPGMGRALACSCMSCRPLLLSLPRRRHRYAVICLVQDDGRRSPAEILAEAYPVVNRQQLSPEQVPMRGTPKNENGRILRSRAKEGQGKSFRSL